MTWSVSREAFTLNHDLAIHSVFHANRTWDKISAAGVFFFCFLQKIDLVDVELTVLVEQLREKFQDRVTFQVRLILLNCKSAQISRTTIRSFQSHLFLSFRADPTKKRWNGTEQKCCIGYKKNAKSRSLLRRANEMLFLLLPSVTSRLLPQHLFSTKLLNCIRDHQKGAVARIIKPAGLFKWNRLFPFQIDKFLMPFLRRQIWPKINSPFLWCHYKKFHQPLQHTLI